MIAALEAKIAELLVRISQLESLKSTLNLSINDFRVACGSLDNVVINLNSNFQYDDIVADKKYSENSVNEINQIAIKIESQVIPSIDSEIARLRAEIASLRVQIEKIKAEEAARAAEAAASSGARRGGPR